jgi:hypothetical protein
MLRAPATRRRQRVIGAAVPRARATAYTIGTRVAAARLRGCAVELARTSLRERRGRAKSVSLWPHSVTIAI